MIKFKRLIDFPLKFTALPPKLQHFDHLILSLHFHYSIVFSVQRNIWSSKSPNSNSTGAENSPKES